MPALSGGQESPSTQVHTLVFSGGGHSAYASDKAPPPPISAAAVAAKRGSELRRSLGFLTVREHLERQEFIAHCRKAAETAQDRLKEVMAVSRQLHKALAKNKAAASELREECRQLDGQLSRSREGELPARERALVELEASLEEEARQAAERKQVLDRGLAEREERVEALSEAVSNLREVGAENRQLLKESHRELREQQRSNRMLKKHIQLLDGVDPGPGRGGRSTCASESSFWASRNSCASLVDSDRPRDCQPFDSERPERRHPSYFAAAAEPGVDSPTAPRKTMVAIDELRSLQGLDLQALLHPSE